MDAPVWLESLVSLPPWAKGTILAVIAGLTYLLGKTLAERWRSEDYGTRLGVTFAAMALAIAVCGLFWPPKLGIDLSGGVILVYEIDEEATQRQQEAQQGITKRVTSRDIVPFIVNRVNPSGLEDVVVRPYGDDQIEVIIPHVESAEIERIKDIISTAGYLEFRIVANPQDHGYLIDEALDEPTRSRLVKDEEGNNIGLWADLGTVEGGDYRMSPLGAIFRNGVTGQVLTDDQGNLRPEFLPADPSERNRLFERFGEDQVGLQNQRDFFENQLGVDRIQILMATDDGYNVRGDHVDTVAAGFDESGFPSINFTMTSDGAVLFQGLTGENSPDPQTGFKRRLGILMDNALISAPELRSMISRNGQITGRFTEEEVNDLVQIIRGGSLPAALTPQPTSESQISPLLGGVTIRQSMVAMLISLAFTLAFMAFYYRFAGLVACFSLVANLVMTFAVMVLLRASFTLPGIAGLILSVGMAVDANILIFERIREELARGAKMRMALRNGFSRATTTIIDANVTTLIAGVVLYAIGTDLIRGFAVTLILGLVISMFTAVYCARAIFEIGDRVRWYRDLKMRQWVRETNVDFLSKQKLAITVSVIVIVVGLIGAGVRGVDMLDIDMAGGTAVDVLLTKPLTEPELSEKLEQERFLAVYHEVVSEEIKKIGPNDPKRDEKLAVLNEELQRTDFDMSLLGLPGYTDDAGRNLALGQAWKVQTSLPSVDHLEEVLKRIFQDDEETQLIMRRVEFSEPEVLAAEDTETDAAPAAPAGERKTGDAADQKDKTKAPATPAATPDVREVPAESKTPATPKTPAAPAADEPTTPEASATPAMPEPPATSETPEAPATPEPSDAPAADEPADPRSAQPRPPAAPAESDEADSPAEPEASPEEPESSEDARLDLPGPNVFAMAGEGDLYLLAQADNAAPADEDAEPAAEPAKKEPAKKEPAKKEPAKKEPAKQEPAKQEPAKAEADRPAANQPASRPRSRSEMKFQYRISGDALRYQILEAAGKVGVEMEEEHIDVKPADDVDRTWTVTLPATPEQTEQILGQLQANFADTPVFPSASKIGSKVASNMQQTAILAMVLSFFGIVVYLWIRFQRVAYGLAAMIATLHDVLVTLAILALTHWLAPVLGFLLIENFKISLTVIAAFLTLIGYSINDKIVIFDRIRELRGKSPHLTVETVNRAVNQTLSRTILTGGTVIVSLLVFYIFGGQGLRAFSFTLLVGIIVGTYSSIYIGAPALLWLAEGSREKSRAAAPSDETVVDVSARS